MLKDTLTMPLALDCSEPATAPPKLFHPKTRQRPMRPYLDWTKWGDEEGWVARWQQDGLLLCAKVEVIDLINPEDATDDHLWLHHITVHSYDSCGEKVADFLFDNVQSPLYDLDIFPMLDPVVHQCADQCVAQVCGQRQQSLLH